MKFGKWLRLETEQQIRFWGLSSKLWFYISFDFCSCAQNRRLELQKIFERYWYCLQNFHDLRGQRRLKLSKIVRFSSKLCQTAQLIDHRASF